MTDDALEITKERLRNWAAWARDSVQYKTCQSLEKRYKAPPVWEAPKPTIEVNLHDAYRVEFCIITLPKKYKEIIVYSFLKSGMRLNNFCKKIKIKESEFNTMEAQSIMLLKRRLFVLDDELAQNK